jgi:hypothetical protein
LEQAQQVFVERIDALSQGGETGFAHRTPEGWCRGAQDAAGAAWESLASGAPPRIAQASRRRHAADGRAPPLGAAGCGGHRCGDPPTAHRRQRIDVHPIGSRVVLGLEARDPVARLGGFERAVLVLAGETVARIFEVQTADAADQGSSSCQWMA